MKFGFITFFIFGAALSVNAIPVGMGYCADSMTSQVRTERSRSADIEPLRAYASMFMNGVVQYAFYDELVYNQEVSPKNLGTALQHFDRFDPSRQAEIIDGVVERIAARLPSEFTPRDVDKVDRLAAEFKMPAIEIIDLLAAWKKLSQGDPLLSRVKDVIRIMLVDNQGTFADSVQAKGAWSSRFMRFFKGPVEYSRNPSGNLSSDIFQLAIDRGPFSRSWWRYLKSLSTTGQRNFAFTHLNSLGRSQLEWVLENLFEGTPELREQMTKRLQALRAIDEIYRQKRQIGVNLPSHPLSDEQWRTIETSLDNMDWYESAPRVNDEYNRLIASNVNRLTSDQFVLICQRWLDRTDDYNYVDNILPTFRDIRDYARQFRLIADDIEQLRGRIALKAKTFVSESAALNAEGIAQSSWVAGQVLPAELSSEQKAELVRLDAQLTQLIANTPLVAVPKFPPSM